MKPKISIIIPVYNVEKYLHRCINSILEQSFKDFELILVDDGSTDSSGEICEKFIEQDRRIQVIHKENGGVSSARNIGIDVAKGEYIAFVDSDDFINRRMYEILYHQAVLHESEMVVCEYINVDEGDQHKPKHQYVKYNDGIKRQLTNIQALNQLYGDNHVSFVVPWNKLYKRSLFKKLRYEEGRIYEDEFIAHRLLFSCTKITYTSKILYYYYQRTGSLIRSPFTIRKFDKIYALNERANFLINVDQKRLHNKTTKAFMELFFWNYLKALDELSSEKKELKKLKTIFDSKLKLLLKNPLVGWKQKLMIIIFYLNPTSFALISARLNKN